nr:acyltransferase family protein [Secundilactobacillus silagei]
MLHTGKIADIGDYLKLTACTAVMLQPILNLALRTMPEATTQMVIGAVYNLVKFTAPAFIFGILYTTMRTTVDTAVTYQQYLKQSWHSLFVPTLWWTSIYLLAMPWVQQVRHYHSWKSFVWQFINGNAAPHLWYNTMMLQFILLMPLFWLIGRWCQTVPKRGWFIVALTLIITGLWLEFYDREVFHGPHMADWYLTDRLFISFLIYGILGTLAWQYRKAVNPWLQKWWGAILLICIASFYWICRELFAFGYPVKLTNAPYYKPSMVIYDLAVIALVAAVALSQIQRQRPITRIVHYLAGFAYKAFLSNVFWEQLIWLTIGKRLIMVNVDWGILITYVGTWLLSFASAVGIHAVWRRIKQAKY